MLLDAGADPDALDEFSTAYKIASRHGLKIFDGDFLFVNEK